MNQSAKDIAVDHEAIELFQGLRKATDKALDAQQMCYLESTFQDKGPDDAIELLLNWSASGVCAIPISYTNRINLWGSKTGSLQTDKYYYAARRAVMRMHDPASVAFTVETLKPYANSKPEFYADPIKPTALGKPQSETQPDTFLTHYATDVSNVAELIMAIARLAKNHHKHHLVWRGQQNVAWPVRSNLQRKLIEANRSEFITEETLDDKESEILNNARDWGISEISDMQTLARLQHYGAPTRLLDVTLDPEVAAWFAVEKDNQHDDADGLIIAWGRVPKLGPGSYGKLDPGRHYGPALPWAGLDEATKLEIGWGTSSKTWAWFPPYYGERMRAQRAGFLFDSVPVLSEQLAKVINEHCQSEWKPADIMACTSILGMPTKINGPTRANGANLVPVFTIRIKAHAKPAIRDYLATKGLSAQTFYPDIEGFASEINKGLTPRRPTI